MQQWSIFDSSGSFLYRIRMDWNDFKILQAVVQAEGAKAAADALNISHATVSRRIAALEKELNVVLVDRTGVGWKITPIGHQLAQHAQAMEFQTQEARRVANAFSTDLNGVVRVSVPTSVLSAFVAPAVRDLRREYPQIRLIFQNEDHLIDLNARKADIAIRFTSSPDPDLIGSNVATNAWGYYANPECLAEITRQVAPNIRPRVPLLTTNADNAFPSWAKGIFDADSPCDYVYGFREKAELAANGFGVTMLPRIIGDAQTGLVFLNQFPCEVTTQLWVLANSDTRHSKRISIVRTMLSKGLKELGGLLNPD